MADPDRKASRAWWVALGLAVGILIGSPRLSVNIQQCDAASTAEASDG